MFTVTNENIRYDVDENLWPNPEDRVDKNIEVQYTLVDFFFSYLKFSKVFVFFLFNCCE